MWWIQGSSILQDKSYTRSPPRQSRYLMRMSYRKSPKKLQNNILLRNSCKRSLRPLSKCPLRKMKNMQSHQRLSNIPLYNSCSLIDQIANSSPLNKLSNSSQSIVSPNQYTGNCYQK